MVKSLNVKVVYFTTLVASTFVSYLRNPSLPENEYIYIYIHVYMEIEGKNYVALWEKPVLSRGNS